MKLTNNEILATSVVRVIYQGRGLGFVISARDQPGTGVTTLESTTKNGGPYVLRTSENRDGVKDETFLEWCFAEHPLPRRL